jgi:hypothetical protein
MVFIVLHGPWSPKQVRNQYRRRFGIECSHRCARQVRGWTTSNDPAYRFLLNVWLRLRWWFAQIPRQRHRASRAAHFRLSRFAKFIARALKDLYGYLHSIDALALQPIT